MKRLFFRNRLFKYIGLPCIVIFLTFIYNEYLIYWTVLSKCSWKVNDDDKLAKLMLIADTHLLGSRNGHWFDKLRREWQQHRAFQTARYLLKPDYIVIMGDLTDEGKWCSDREWDYYEKRVEELFYVDDNTELIVVVGNHDVGFHYDMIDRKIERFNKTYKSQFIDLYQTRKKNDLNFVILNSMALENDGCKFCKKAQLQLKWLNKTLECLKDNQKCTKSLKNDSRILNRVYSRPIVFTHFPLYRKSDSICPQDIDSELNVIEKNPIFRAKYDCLSLESTKQLIDMVNPRLVFDGHTHYSCYNELHGVPEYTIASFSWRNIKTPSMLLLQLDSESDHDIPESKETKLTCL